MFEKVNPCHPDKLADRIAGALVDLAYAKSENPKIAVEVLIGHGVCHVVAETSVVLDVADVRSAVRRIAEKLKVDYREVAQDTHLAANQADKFRCGDNGIFKGVPVTDEQMKLTDIARTILRSIPRTENTFWTASGSLSVKAMRTPPPWKSCTPMRSSTRSAIGRAAQTWTRARPTASSARIWRTRSRAVACTAKTSRKPMCP